MYGNLRLCKSTWNAERASERERESRNLLIAALLLIALPTQLRKGDLSIVCGQLHPYQKKRLTSQCPNLLHRLLVLSLPITVRMVKWRIREICITMRTIHGVSMLALRLPRAAFTFVRAGHICCRRRCYVSSLLSLMLLLLLLEIGIVVRVAYTCSRCCYCPS